MMPLDSRVEMYDHFRALDAVVFAWTRPGPHPPTHQRLKDQVRTDWPILARALDRLTKEIGEVLEGAVVCDCETSPFANSIHQVSDGIRTVWHEPKALP